MKRKISGIFFGLLFLAGFGILIYPTVSDLQAESVDLRL